MPARVIRPQINGFHLNAFALEPIAHSRSTLAAVVIAHVAAGLLVVQLFEARRYIDPAPLMIDLLPAPEQKVDVVPQPLPQAPEPVREVKREPEPVKPEPVIREEPKPIERVVRSEPAPEVAPPPPQMAPPVPTPPPPIPEPVAVAVPEPTAITIPVPPAPVIVPQPVIDVPDITMTAQMLTAVYLRNPKPSYPGISRRLGEQGTVFLRVFVTAIGDPTRVELKTSSGHPRLDQSAQEAVQRWKFVPARRGEQAVDAWVVVPIKFSLKG
jgi:periplasmic protein TonB